VCKLGFFLARFTCILNWPTHAKKVQFTQERVEYNVFLFDEPLKGSKSLKILKISLTFHFGKLTFIKIRSRRKKFSNSDSVVVSTKKLLFSERMKLLLFIDVNYPTSTRRHGNFAGVHTLLRILLSSNSAVLINIITGVLPPHFDFVVYYVLCQC
jgi:hypothetical protein